MNKAVAQNSIEIKDFLFFPKIKLKNTSKCIFFHFIKNEKIQQSTWSVPTKLIYSLTFLPCVYSVTLQFKSLFCFKLWEEGEFTVFPRVTDR